jgi:hypothetical protein
MAASASDSDSDGTQRATDLEDLTFRAGPLLDDGARVMWRSYLAVEMTSKSADTSCGLVTRWSGVHRVMSSQPPSRPAQCFKS